jgi:RNA polymerase sigma-70 factor (sigma-E family)
MRSADAADFALFVSASSRRLLRTAYLLTGDPRAAEDLLQTALEKAYRQWSRIRRKDIPEAYVRRIMVNAATDTWRRQRRTLEVELDEARLPSVVDAQLEGVLARSMLMDGVRQLSAGQRAVLVLRYFDDLTEAETAKALGCSVGTVKSQNARAMARLRELLPTEGRSL